MSRNEEKHIRRMADLLRQGETLTELGCPACASPLFKLRSGKLWCAKCVKRVIIEKKGETSESSSSSVFGTLETTLLAKINEIQNKIKKEQDMRELKNLSRVLTELLDNLEKTRRVKRARRKA